MTKHRILHNTINILTVSLFAVFILFDTYSWGKYAFLAITLMIFILGYWERNVKVKIRFDAYFFLNISFIFFVALTSLWAINAESTLIMARTLVRVFVCAYAVYLYFVTEKDMYRLLRILMWAGYVVAIYTLTFYGVDNLLKAGRGDSQRVQNSFSNINSIAQTCALSCMIQANEFFEKRNRITCIFLIPALIVIAATQSRKALMLLIMGVFVAFIVKNQNESLIKKTIKILFGCIIAGILVYFLLQLEIFSGVLQRIEGMFDAFLGGGKNADESSLTRQRMIEIGWETFKENPLGGVGISNSYYITDKYLHWETYLHNNFIELLACGGIFGFSLYYAIYVYLFYNLWKYRKADKKQAMFFACWLLIMLVLDYGMVSYFFKTQNFYFMIHFSNIENLKRKAFEQKETNKIKLRGFYV